MKPSHLVAVILGVALLYPLSIGPVMQRGLRPAFYDPLFRSAKAAPPFRDILLWYLDCWGVAVNTSKTEKLFHGQIRTLPASADRQARKCRAAF